MWVIPKTDFSVPPQDWKPKDLNSFFLLLIIKTSTAAKLFCLFFFTAFYSQSTLISHITYTPILSLSKCLCKCFIHLLIIITIFNFSAPFPFIHHCYFLWPISAPYLELIYQYRFFSCPSLQILSLRVIFSSLSNCSLLQATCCLLFHNVLFWISLVSFALDFFPFYFPSDYRHVKVNLALFLSQYNSLGLLICFT